MTNKIDYSNPANWQAYDVEHIWHPYTNIAVPTPVFPVSSAQGVMIRLADGRELIDGMSSWWAAIHGYNHPVLNAAIETQLQSMSHVMFGGLTHEPAVRLAETLINITAESLQYVFFADSGSVAVEVAIKMALQYQVARGQKNKNRLLTVRNGYHGDTFGAMAVCDPLNGMHSLFSDILPQHYFADAPECSDQGVADVDQFSHIIEQNHQSIAAVTLEPLVQGAGGMRFYCADYLCKVKMLCDQYDVLLILDEIATGFGRSGSLFAYEQAGIEPDILCLGKALTGGYMTLAATLTSEKVAATISRGEPGNLMHGPTFMANPLACAVANASIDLLLRSDWQRQVNRIETQLMTELAACKKLAVVKEVRVKGAIGVVELNQAVDLHWIQSRFVEQGVWIRPFNNLVYVMPPYIIQADELSQLTLSILNVLTEMKAIN